MKKKSWLKKNRVLIGMLGIFLVSASFMTYHFYNKPDQKLIAADISGPIKVDEGTAHELVVPKDATTNYEKYFKTTAVGDGGFYQNDVVVPNIRKGIMNSFSTPLSDHVMDLLPVDKYDDGIVKYPAGYLAILQNRNDGELGIGGAITSYILRLDSDGNTLVRREIGTDNSITTVPTTPINPIKNAKLPSLLVDNKDGTYSVLYRDPDHGVVNPEEGIFDGKLSLIQYEPTPMYPDLSGAEVGNYFRFDDDRVINTGYIYNGVGANHRVPVLLTPNPDILVRLQMPDMTIYAKDLLSSLGQGGTWVTDLRTTSDGGYFGVLRFGTFATQNAVKGYKDMLAKWDENGDLKWVLANPATSGEKTSTSIVIQKQMSDDANVYYIMESDTSSNLYKINVSSNTSHPAPSTSNELSSDLAKDMPLLKSYPPGTYSIVPFTTDYGTKYQLYGRAKKLVGEFSNIRIDDGDNVVLIAYLDTDFTVRSGGGFKLGTVAEKFVMKHFVLFDETDNKYFTIGNTDSIDFANPPISSSGWTPPINNSLRDDNFMGAIYQVDDWAPGLKFSKDIGFNRDNKIKDWDSLMLDGVEVDDNYDLHLNNFNPKTQAWLDARINRNHKTEVDDGAGNLSYAPIDWTALGLDKINPGPQQIKYFITDNSLQTTAKSRWINKTTDRTVEEKDHFIDAHDFTIPLINVGTLKNNAELVKNNSQTLAWYKTKDNDNNTSYVIDEEARNDKYYDKVTINQAQWDAIVNTKIAKPFPLTFYYEGTDTEGKKVVVEQRVTVFITDDTTDENEDLVIYANDYSIPLYKAKNEKKQDVYNNSDVKVYEFDINRPGETGTETIADKDKKTERLTPDGPMLTAIQDSDYPRILPMEITYTGKDKRDKPVSITSKIKVTLIPEVLLHLRQVVLEPMKELVIPSEGYFNLNNVKLTDVKDKADLSYNVITESTIEIPGPGYKDIIVPFEFDYNEADLTKQFGGITVTDIIPEYYQYDGHVITYDKSILHQSSAKTDAAVLWPIIDDKEHHEAWLTVYLKPVITTTEHPKPYSWDYKLNDFGEVTE